MSIPEQSMDEKILPKRAVQPDRCAARDYFNRFSNLREVTAYCPLDELHFSVFLRKVYSLQTLNLYSGSMLSQHFFDALCLSSLFYLYLFKSREWYASEIDKSEQIKLNFKFIDRFQKLKYSNL